MTLCGGTTGTLTSGGGTPDRGGRTPFRPVPAEFNHCSHLTVFSVTGEPSSPDLFCLTQEELSMN